MLLFHGSDAIVEEPRLMVGRKTLDFGPGFYTTTNREQADSFAAKVQQRREGAQAVVSMYEADLEQMTKELDILRFEMPDEAWLDFVSENRNGTYAGRVYDIVYGPVADDTIYKTFIAYEAGVLTKEETIARLKIKELYDQMTFATEKALMYLRFVGTEVLEGALSLKQVKS